MSHTVGAIPDFLPYHDRATLQVHLQGTWPWYPDTDQTWDYEPVQNEKHIMIFRDTTDKETATTTT